jgi:NAD(P)H-dependent FMN reductase
MRTGEVLLVSGSLRRGSYNSAVLREAANALPSGVGHVWLDGIAALPPYTVVTKCCPAAAIDHRGGRSGASGCAGPVLP